MWNFARKYPAADSDIVKEMAPINSILMPAEYTENTETDAKL